MHTPRSTDKHKMRGGTPTSPYMSGIIIPHGDLCLPYQSDAFVVSQLSGGVDRFIAGASANAYFDDAQHHLKPPFFLDLNLLILLLFYVLCLYVLLTASTSLDSHLQHKILHNKAIVEASLAVLSNS